MIRGVVVLDPALGGSSIPSTLSSLSSSSTSSPPASSSEVSASVSSNEEDKTVKKVRGNRRGRRVGRSSLLRQHGPVHHTRKVFSVPHGILASPLKGGWSASTNLTPLLGSAAASACKYAKCASEKPVTKRLAQSHSPKFRERLRRRAKTLPPHSLRTVNQ